MRKKSKKQMPLMSPAIDHPRAEELHAISRILDSNPIIYDLVMQDLCPKKIKSKAGAKGMSAEQVIRAAIVKQMFAFSYQDLVRLRQSPGTHIGQGQRVLSALRHCV